MIVNTDYDIFVWNLQTMHQRGRIKRMPKNPRSLHTAILKGKPKTKKQAFKHLDSLLPTSQYRRWVVLLPWRDYVALDMDPLYQRAVATRLLAADAILHWLYRSRTVYQQPMARQQSCYKQTCCASRQPLRVCSLRQPKQSYERSTRQFQQSTSLVVG